VQGVDFALARQIMLDCAAREHFWLTTAGGFGCLGMFYSESAAIAAAVFSNVCMQSITHNKNGVVPQHAVDAAAKAVL
jgi:hypothetical protein